MNSNSNLQTNNEPDSASKLNFKIIIWTIVIIVVIAAIVFAILFFTNKQKITPEEQAPPETENLTEPTKKIPAVINSYIGEIVEISGNSLKIEALAYKNNLLTDSFFTINTTEQTKFYTVVFPQKLTGDPNQDQMQRTQISFSDLEIGQNVLVVSSENIKDQASFTATKIEIQEIK